jgi:nitrogen fixation NifU-like protein
LRHPCAAAILAAMHSPAVLDHFQHPRNLGDLPGATATVDVTNPVCGDELRLAVRIVDGRVAEAKFRARGCQAAMACSSVLTEMIAGKTIAELREITAEQIAAALGGLPPATRHGSQLAEDALDAILDKRLEG